MSRISVYGVRYSSIVSAPRECVWVEESGTAGATVHRQWAAPGRRDQGPGDPYLRIVDDSDHTSTTYLRGDPFYVRIDPSPYPLDHPTNPRPARIVASDEAAAREAFKRHLRKTGQAVPSDSRILVAPTGEELS